ncbi:helix-turn-helix domain-containing protein [Intestinibacillus massiliensis]|uniref:helix-turn-helix domain-containing protein n=1 Tax=Intestinibacillus massiliensis TaxID=1871029 RepID=UPI000B35710A|nr:helix-turn-helix transcriptional regulator [Intestinibacillus massiliensis]MCB6367192.1 helix-turn-helix domain-containing protein [Intestinibacillus massiliensis]
MGIDYRVIGQRIKQRRKSIRKTQDNLAEALSVSVGYISQIERGVTRPNLDTLARIAGFLGCDLAELVTGVMTAQDGYLQGELQKVCVDMTDAQRSMLLEIAQVIVEKS